MARVPDYPALAYRYYRSRGITPRGLYNASLYAVVLLDLPIGHVDAESIINCAGITVPAIGCQRRRPSKHGPKIWAMRTC